jgi:hypothetical protein
LGGNIARAIGLQGAIEGVTDWVERLNKAMAVTTGTEALQQHIQEVYAQIVRLNRVEQEAIDKQDALYTQFAMGQINARALERGIAALNVQLDRISQRRFQLNVRDDINALGIAYAMADAAGRTFMQNFPRAAGSCCKSPGRS